MKATYIKTRLSEIITINKIVTIHYQQVGKSFTFEGEAHDFWELVYLDAGKVKITSDGVESVLEQGDIIFHKPNEFHTIRAYESTPNIFIISFECRSQIMSMFENLKLRITKELKDLFYRIMDEANSTFDLPLNDPFMRQLRFSPTADIGGEQIIKNYLELSLIAIVRMLNSERNAEVFSSRDRMENHLTNKITELVQANLENKLTVSQICSELGYSAAYLSRIFKQNTGNTIANYICTCKINRAKQLIREDNYNFTKISSMLAFDNPLYFGRVFRRMTQMSPTEYKKSLRL